MRQRLSVVTLGVADADRAAAFDASLGWQRIEDGGGTAPRLFKLEPGLLLALYDRKLLGEDATLASDECAVFGGVILAQCVASPEAVDSAMASATAARRYPETRRSHVLGRLRRILRRSGRPCLGGRFQSVVVRC